MTVFSNYWTKNLEAEVLRKLRNAPHPKDGRKTREKIRARDVFPKRKPGEGGFDMNKKPGGGNKGAETTSE